MVKSKMELGLVKIFISDERPEAKTVEIANITFNALKKLIPFAKKIAKEERQQIMDYQANQTKLNDDCSECESCEDSENCEHSTSKKRTLVDKKISDLYV